jgi:hypothetical protein
LASAWVVTSPYSHSNGFCYPVNSPIHIAIGSVTLLFPPYSHSNRFCILIVTSPSPIRTAIGSVTLLFAFLLNLIRYFLFLQTCCCLFIKHRLICLVYFACWFSQRLGCSVALTVPHRCSSFIFSARSYNSNEKVFILLLSFQKITFKEQ